jgi:outer membrane protein TolC
MSKSSARPRASFGEQRRWALRHAALAAVALCWPVVVAAQSPLSFAEALRLAVDRSGQVASQRAMVDAAREMTIPAGELPDPKLRVGVENVPAEGPDRGSLTRDAMTMQRIGLMQEFPRAEKRELKVRRAERDAERGDVAVEAAMLAVRREAATAWLAQRHAVDAEQVIAAQIGEAELAATTVGAAYRAGRAPQADWLMAQSQIVELRNRATEAATTTKRARIALARYVGADAQRTPGAAPDTARLPFDPATLAAVDLQPESRLALAQEAVAAADADIARAAKQADWSAELSYGVRGPGYPNMVSLMFSLDLPWSAGTRQDREYAAKLKERDAAHAMREDTLRMRGAEVEAMLAEWESARAQAQRTRDELIPLAEQRREAALAAYRGGAGSLAGVLDARRALLDARLALIALDQAAAKAWAWLRFVIPAAEAA